MRVQTRLAGDRRVRYDFAIGMAFSIIDIHTHIFPDELAPRAVKQLAGRSGETAFLDGTAAGLEESMRRHGIGISVTQPVSTKASQIPSINAFAIALQQRSGLVNFGSLFPDYEGNAAEIERLREAGIKGVKFHPDYQQFYVDEERMFPLYRLMADAGLIAFFHAGVDIGLGPPYHGLPDRLATVLERVPDLTVVAAHFGGFQLWDDVDVGGGDDAGVKLENIAGSEALHLAALEDLAILVDEDDSIPPLVEGDMARRHGIGKILFGSDSPWADQGVEIELHRKCGLTQTELAAVFHDNAAQLLGVQ